MKKKTKEYRRKAKVWLLSTDRAMQVTMGVGWAAFVPDPRQWPICVASCDQGSDGWSAAHYMQYGAQAGLMLLRDPSHRLWNNASRSLRDSGLWPLALLMCVW